MRLKDHLRDYSTFIGIILVQVIIVGTGLVMLSTTNTQTSLITYDVGDNKQAESQVQTPQVTGTDTQRGLIVSINVGTSEELQLLPGIGETRAQAIIDYREENGPFKNLEDIKNISGIGDQIYENIKPFISL